MEPGFSAPYQIRATDSKYSDSKVCLRVPGGNINQFDKWKCDNYLKDETWFYTKDKTLVSAGYGKQLCADNRSGGNLFLETKSIANLINDENSIKGNTWTWDSTSRNLTFDASDGKLCLNLWEQDGGARDIEISTCDPGQKGQKLTITPVPDQDYHEKAQCKRVDQHNFAYNFQGDITPDDSTKYKCCTKKDNETTSKECGYKYCKGSETCNTFLKNTYCPTHASDPVCTTLLNKTQLADYCLQGNRILSDPSCREMCNLGDSATIKQCEQAALLICANQPNMPQCACLSKVYNPDGTINKNDPDYKTFIAGMPADKIPALGDPGCWLSPCAEDTSLFSALFRKSKKYTLTCPTCVQALEVKNSNFDSAIIKQSCAVTPAASPSASNSGGGGGGGGDSGGGGGGGSASATSSGDIPWYKQTNYIIGLVVCILICLSCSFGLFAILLSKK